MKLHLPSFLRKALLACLASLAAHSLPVTVSTGSLVASGALISFLSAQQSIAAEDDDDDEDGIALFSGEDDASIAPIAASGAQFTGPDVEWNTPDAELGGSEVSGMDDLDTVEDEAIASTVWGQGKQIAGGRGKSLKLVRNSSAGNPTKLQKSGDRGLEVTNLWLTSERTGTYNYYTIDQEGYLTSYIQDIWINAVGVSIGNENSAKINVSGLEANFHLGASATSSLTDHAALEVNNASLTTNGYLDIVQDAVLVLRSNVSSLDVSELQGDGDLMLSTAAATSAGATLTLRNGGASYGGALTFGGAQAMNVILGSAESQESVTLQTTGLKGTSGAAITRADGSSQNVTLKITGNDDANTASNITIDSGVLLQLEDGAKQSFASSTISGGAAAGANSTLSLNNSSLSGDITLGAGSTLSLSGTTTVSGGVLTLNGDATFNIVWDEELSLDFTSIINSGEYHINLSIADIASFTNGSYRIFENWQDGWENIFSFAGSTVGHRTISFVNGSVEVHSAELVWDDTDFRWVDETDLMDANNGGGAGWKLEGNANYFTNGDVVEFKNDEGGTVTLGSNITTDNMTIAAGTWVFAADNHTLSVNGTLDVGANTITLDGGTFDIASLEGSGTVTYSGTGLTIGDGSGFTGLFSSSVAVTLSDVSFGPGGTLKLLSGSTSTLNNFTGNVIVDAAYNNGATTLSVSGTLTGDVTYKQNGYINLTANAHLGTANNTLTVESEEGLLKFFQDGNSYVDSQLVGVKKLHFQGPGTTYFTAAFDGISNRSKSLRVEKNTGGYYPKLVFDGKVSNMSSFFLTGGNNKDAYITFAGGLDISEDLTLEVELGTYNLNSALTGSGDIIFRVSGNQTTRALTFGTGANFDAYTGTLQVEGGTVTLNVSGARTDGSALDIELSGGSLTLGNVAGKLGTVTTAGTAITINVSNAWTVGSLVVGSGGVTFDGAGALTLSSLDGSGLLTKAGTGALNLAGDATNGSIALSAGITMNLTAAAGEYTLGSFSTSGSTGTMVLNQNTTNQKWTINQLTVAEGTTLTLAGSDASNQGANRYIAINGMIGGTGTITLNGGTLRVSGESGFGGSMSVITSGCLVLEEGAMWGSELTLSRYKANSNIKYQGALVMFNGSSVNALITLSGDTRIESGADSDQYKMYLNGGIDANGHNLEVVWGKFDITGDVSNLGEIYLTNTTLTIKSNLTADSVTNATLSIGKANGAYEGELYLSGSVSGITHFVNNNRATNGTGSLHEMFFTGSLDLAEGADFTGNDGGHFNISGSLTGSGNFTKLGTSNLTISGEITHTGGLTIEAGSVFLNSDAASMADGVTLNSGSLTLGGGGGTLQALTLNAASTVTLNNNWKLGSQLTVAAEKALTLNGGGSLELAAGAVVSSSITLADGSSLILSGGNFDLSNGGSLLGTGTLVIGPGGASIQLGSVARAIGDIFGTGIALDLSQAWGDNNQVQLFSFEGWAWEGDAWTTFANAVYDMVRAGTTISPRATLSLNQSGLLTLGAGGAIVWNGGEDNTWTVSETATGEGWLTEADNSATTFIDNDLVIFNSEASVTLGGAITAGSMTVDIAGTDSELGTLTLRAGEGSLTVSRGVTVTQGALVIDGTGTGVYTLGDVSLAEGTEFRITHGGTNPFAANGTTVHGDGSLVITATSDVAALFTSLLSVATDAATLNATKLHELRVSGANGTAFQIINPSSSALARVEHLVLKDVTLTVNGNNSLLYGNNRLIDSEGNIIANVLHLSGNASDNTRANLHTTNGATVQWDVTLDDNASIGANNAVKLTISGALRVKEGKTLTIGSEADSGWGVVEFQNVAEAGDIIVRGGTAWNTAYGTLAFNFTGLANRDAFSMKAAKTIDLTVEQSKLQLTGNGAGITYEIENLKGNGTVLRDGNNGTAILQISNALTAADGAFSGTIDSSISVSVAGGYWAFGGRLNGGLSVSGTGILELSGATFAAGSELNASSGTVHIGAEGLTLNGGVLKLSGTSSLTGLAVAQGVSLFSAVRPLAGETSPLININVEAYFGDAAASALQLDATQASALITLLEANNLRINLTGTLTDGAHILDFLDDSVSVETKRSLADLIFTANVEGVEEGQYVKVDKYGVARVFDSTDDLVWGGGNGNWNSANWDDTPEYADDYFVEWASGKNAIFRAGTDGAGGTVTLADTISVGSLTVESGAWTFSGNYTLNAGQLVIAKDATLTIDGDDKYNSIHASGITLNRGGKLVVTVYATGDVSSDFFRLIQVEGEGSELATLDIRRAKGNDNLSNPSFSIENRNLRVRLVAAGINDGDNWSEFFNISLLTEVGLVGRDGKTTDQINLNGANNKIGRITYVEGETVGNLVLESDGKTNGVIAHLTLGGEDWEASTIAGYLDLRANAMLTLGSDLTVRGGIRSNGGTGQSIVAAEGFDANLTIDSNTGQTYNGSVNLNGGTLTKSGNASQTIGSSVTAGNINVTGGTLALGSGATLSGNATVGTTLNLGSDSTLSIGGLLSGSGTLGLITPGAAATVSITNSLNSGDAFSGTIASGISVEVNGYLQLDDATLNGALTLTDGTIVSNGGTFGGSITHNAGSLSLTGATLNGTLTSTGGSLTLNGGTLNGSLTATGSSVTLSGALSLGSGVSLDLAGANSLALDGLTSLNINAGGHLNTSLAVFTLSEGQLGDFAEMLSGLTTLDIQGITSEDIDNDWRFNFLYVAGVNVAGDAMLSILETMNAALSEHLDGKELTWKNNNGVLGLVFQADDLWWTGGENGDAEWDAAGFVWTDEQGGDGSVFFAEYANVHFEGEGEKSVTLNGTFKASTLTVHSGNWTFGSNGGSTLTLVDGLTVVEGMAEFMNVTLNVSGIIDVQNEDSAVLFAEGANLTLDNATLLGNVIIGFAQVPGEGDVDSHEITANVTLNGVTAIGSTTQGSTLLIGGDGEITAGADGGLRILGESQVIISTSGAKSLGNVTLDTDSVLTITDATDWSGTTITGAGTLDLLFKAGEVDLATLSSNILGTTANALGRLDLAGGATYTLGSDVHTRLASAKEVHLAAGSTIHLTNGEALSGVNLYLDGEVGSVAQLDLDCNPSGGLNVNFSGESVLRFTGNGYTDSRNLAFSSDGGKLTIFVDNATQNNKYFWLLSNTTFTGTGTLVVKGGKLLINGVDASGFDFVLESGASIGSGQSSLTNNGVTIGSLSGSGNLSNFAPNLVFNLTIDYSGASEKIWSGATETNGINITKAGSGTQVFTQAWSSGSVKVENGTLELVAGGSASGNAADGASLSLGAAGTLALGGDFTVTSLATSGGTTITRSTRDGASTGDVFLVLGMQELAATVLSNITFATVTDAGDYQGKRVALKNSVALTLTGTATIGTDWTLGANLTLGADANITLDGALTFGTMSPEGATNDVSYTLTLTGAEMTVSDIIYTEDISILGSGTFTLNLAQDRNRVAGKGITVGAMADDGTASGPKFVLKGANTLEIGGSDANINFYGDVEVVKDTNDNNATLKIFGTPNAAIYGALSGDGTLALQYATLALYQNGSIGTLSVANDNYLNFGTTDMRFTAAALSGTGTLHLNLLENVTSGTLVLTNDISMEGGLDITGATVELANGKTLTLGSLTMAKGSAAINTTTGGTATVVLTGNLALNGNHELTLGDGVSLTGTNVELDGKYIDKDDETTFVTHRVGGLLTLTGDLTINGQSSTAGSNKLYLNKGGSVTGSMKVGWGASLYLGDDLEVGSIVSAQIGTGSSINKEGTGDVFLFNKDMDGVSSVAAFNAKYTIEGLTIDTNIGYGVVSNLTLSEGGTFNRAFKVKGTDSTLTLGGAEQAYIFSKAVSGNGSIVLADAAGLTLSEGGSITSLTVNGASSITLGRQFSVGTLDLGAASNGVTLAVSGLTAHTDTSNGWLLDIAALAAGSAGKLTIDLSGVTGLTAGTYDFFGANWNAVKDRLQGLISIETGKQWLEATVDANGYITIAKGATAELTWNVDADSDEWNTSDHTWLENGIAFSDGNSVIFDHATGETVTVADGVAADAMTVVQGTGWEFAMQGDMEVSTLTIEANAKATFSDEGTLELGTLSGAGTFGVAAGTTVDLSSTTTGGFTGSLEVNGALTVGSMNVSGLSGSGELTFGGSGANAGAVTFGIGSASTFTGSVTLAQNTTISAGGNSITFGHAAEGTTAASTFDFGNKVFFLDNVSNGTINGDVTNLAAIKFIGENGSSVLHITGDVTGADSTGIDGGGAANTLLVHQHSGTVARDHKLYLDGAVRGISTFDVVTASLYFGGTLTASNEITFSGGGAKYILGTLTGEENISLTGGALTLGGELTSNLEGYTGTLTASGGTTLNVLSAFGGDVSVAGNTNLTLAGTVASLNITSSSGWPNANTIGTNVHITSATAEVSGDFTTSHMMGIEFASGAQLTVGGTLTIGSSASNIGGNFRLAMAANAETPATLVLSEGGTIGERLVLEDGITVKIGSGKTLTVGWLQEYADTHTAGGTITTTTTDGTATLKLVSTGKSDSASGLTFESGITLELSTGVTQTLSDSTIKGDVQLDGAGAVLTITGDNSSFAGTLKGDGGSMKVTGTLAFSGTVDTAGGAGLALADGGTLNLNHTDATAHNLGTVAITNGGAINVQSGEWSLGGLDGGLTSLNVATGATLEVGAGSMQVGTLTLAGTLAVTELSATDALFAGITTFTADAFTLDLSGWDMAAGEYRLFDGAAGDWSVGTLTIDGYKKTNWEVTYADGVLTINKLWDAFEWGGEADNIVWGGDDTATWDGMAWEKGADVTFNGSAATEGGVVDVTVQDDIVAGAMLVESGSYSFSSNTGTSHTLTADSLTVEEGADAEFGLDVTTGSLSGAGDVTMNGAKLTVETDMADFDGSIDLKNDGTLATGGDMSLSGGSLASSAGTGNVELGGNLTFEDFSDGMISGSLHFSKAAGTTADSVNVDLHVGDGAANTVKTPNWSFADDVTLRKTGAGKLTLDGGLGGYTGFIYVDEGRLELLSDNQSLAGGFGFNLNKLDSGNVGDAYLQGGTLTLPDDGTTTTLQLDVDGQLGLGVYYLASGLGVEKKEDARDLFDTVLPSVGENQELQLYIENGTLVLRVMQSVGQDEFVWDGDLGTDGSKAGEDSNWRGDANADHSDLDAIFDASARNQDVVFHNEGDGAFRSAHVRSGEYTFDNAKGGDGFTLTNGLYVGGYVEDGMDSASEARAELKGENAGLSLIEVRENGTLVISSEKAVAPTAKIYLDENGVIAYGDTASGKLLFSGDLSDQIQREDTAHVTSGVLQIQVGRSSDELPGAQPYAAYAVRSIAMFAAANETVPANTVVWGSTDGDNLTSGVKGILEDGVVKLGHGTLEVQWKAAQFPTDFVPTLTKVDVQDGTLNLRVGSGTGTTLAGGDGTVLNVEEGATLQFNAEGSGSRFTVNRAITGAGRVVIGTQTDAGNYTLGGDNGAFTGTLELLGNSSNDYVTLTAVGAVLGGKDATLKLNGREIGLDGTEVTADDVELTAGTVEVAAGSVNRLGGVSQNGAKPQPGNGVKNITLTGALTGTGTLVAAAGAKHTLSGELSGFTGTLNTEDKAVWTLSGKVDGSVLAAKYSGEGSIISDMGDVTLTGAFSDAVSLDVQSGTVKLTNAKNTATGELNVNGGATVQVGDEKTAGTWGLNNEAVRLGAGTGTLKLVNGTVGNIVSKGGATVQVSAAGTTVQVSGTNGEMFDKIDISENGKLSGVSGTIHTKDTQVTLSLTMKNVGTAPDAKGALIEMQPDGVLMLDGTGDNALTLDLDQDVFMHILTDEAGTGEYFLHLLNEAGELKLSARMSDWMDAVTGENLTILLDTDFNLRRAEDAKNEMVISGTSKNVYLVLGPDDAPDAKSRPHTVSDYGVLSDKYYATVVDSQATLTLEVGDMPTDAVIADEEDEDRRAALRRDMAAGGMLVRNLVGQAGATLHAVKNSTGNDVTVVFDNSRIADLVNLDTTGVDSSLNADVRGQDTHFLGTIVGDEGVNFDKQGKGTLYVGNETDGGVKIAGEVKVSEGALAVTSGAKGSSIGSLAFNYTTSAAAGEKRGFAVSGGSLELGAIDENNEGAGRAGHTGDNVIRVVEEGDLTLNFADDALLLTTHLEGDGSGSLTVDGSRGGSVTLNSDGMSAGEQTRISDMDLHVTNKGKLTLTQGSKISNGDVWVENGSLELQTDAALNTSGSLKLDKNGALTLDETASADVRGGAQVDGKLTVGGGRVALTQLSGSGTIAGGNGSSLTLRGAENSFSGALTGEGTIYVTKGAALTLDNVTRGTDSTDGRWNVDNRGSLTVNLTKVDPKHKTELGNVTLGSGSQMELVIDTDAANYGERMSMSRLGWEAGATLQVTTTGSRAFLGDGIDLGALSGTLQDDVSALKIKLDGMAFLHYEVDTLYKNGAGHLILGMEKLSENLFSKYSMSGNALAGADMFWNASDPNSANWQKLTNNFFDALRSDLYWMVSGLNDLQREGKVGELATALAAGAGASTSTLGSALSQDIRRQLNAIRNRTTMMAGDQQYDTYDAAPYYHVWINGEGSYHKLDADGLNPGFSLNSWGGTVGAEMELSDSTTVGLALSAMYGDLKTDSADNGRGDMDTTYLTAFARMAQGAWVHTFVVSGGLADVKLNRTVSCGSFSYNTHGSTDGYALGALYEVGYATAMNADRTFVLQTVFNVEFRHTAINGYTESGSDAGLTVGDISHDALTFGAGARMQALVGERVFNRAAVLEGRVLVKADAGDRKGVSDNALTNGDGTVRRLNSAEVGVMGVEIGAGINIPLGSEYGSIFFDASVELRSGYTSMDANVGYRVSF